MYTELHARSAFSFLAGASLPEELASVCAEREMEDREIAPSCPAVAERADVPREVFVDRQREQVGVVAHAAQQIADAPGAVADGVAAMSRRHPLVDDHGNSQFTIHNRQSLIASPCEL